jgi:hypothetical protein
MLRWLVILLTVSLLQVDFFPPEIDPAGASADAPYSARFAELGFNRPLTIMFYDLTDASLLAGVEIDKQMPVVSAIKGPILLYFFYYVDPAVWDSVPVAYWTETNALEVPIAYRTRWEDHRAILRDLYRMIVNSDNASTGNVLRYAYDYTGMTSLNPIQAFNRWSVDVVGISEESGLREWDEGGTDNPAWIEPRFDNRTTTIRNVPRFYNNTFSALDMARYYHWLYDQQDTPLYDRAVDVMSVVAGFPGFLEDTALRLDGTPVSKDGFVGPGDRGNPQEEYLTTDAGLILLDDRALIMVTMGVNGGDKLDEVYNEVQTIIRRDRAELYWPPDVDFLTWARDVDGPYAGEALSTEGLYFVLDYMTGAGARPEPGQTLTAQQALFDEARRVWLAIFPDDSVPAERTPEQARVMAARYGGSGERLYDIAVDLGYVEPND